MDYLFIMKTTETTRGFKFLEQSCWNFKSVVFGDNRDKSLLLRFRRIVVQ